MQEGQTNVFTCPLSASLKAQVARGQGDTLTFLLPACEGMRRLFVTLGLVALGITLVLFFPRPIPKTVPLRVVVLATWFTNNEQFVTFRAEPPTAEITFVDTVPASYDDRFQPRTMRAFWDLIPVHTIGETNPLLHFVALPIRGASFGGKPVAYTPGSYTVAYTPTKKIHRLRAGIAFQESGMDDYFQRIRNCWYQNSLGPLSMKSHQDPIFVTTGAITNIAASREGR